MKKYIKFLFKYIITGVIFAVSASLTGILIVKAVWGLNATSWETLTAVKWNELVDKVAGVTTSGWNVGIGQTNPSATLEVYNTAWTNDALAVNTDGSWLIASFSKGWIEKVVIANDGKVGIGTTDPKSVLHVNGNNDGGFELKVTDSNNAGIEIRSSGTNKNTYIDFVDTSTNDSSYWTPDWHGRIMYDGTFDAMNFYTSGSGNPSMYLNNAGDVWVGTTTPNGKFDIRESGDGLVVREIASNRIALQVYIDAHWSDRATYAPFETNMILQPDTGYVGIGVVNPQGKLDVNWTIYQRWSELHADYVFEPEYELESIEEHNNFMWQNKHLKAVPKATKDSEWQDIVEWWIRNKGILEELEKAHVYIGQLNEQNKLLKQEIEEIKEILNK